MDIFVNCSIFYDFYYVFCNKKEVEFNPLSICSFEHERNLIEQSIIQFAVQ